MEALVDADVSAAIARQGLDAKVHDLGAPLTTAAAAAVALGVPVARVFKSLVVTDGTVVAVLVLEGDRRVDLKAAARALGVKNVRLADPDVVLRETGYVAGGTPPFGHKTTLPVVLDEGLFEHADGYGGGGRPELLVQIRPDELRRATGGTVTRIARPR